MLNLDELEKELSWGMRNPWGTGITDVFELRPSILLPCLPDFSRQAAMDLYRKHGFVSVGFPGSSAFRIATHHGIRLFPFIRIRARDAGPKDPAVQNLCRLVGGREDLFLVIELSGLTSLRPLQFLLENAAAPLVSGIQGGSAILSNQPPAPPLPRSPRLDWSLFPASVLRRKLEATSALARRKRKKTEEYRKILVVLSPNDLPSAEEEGAEEPPESDIRLVAQMLGEVMLAGGDFDVRLVGGRFCGINRQGKPLIPQRPAVSYIRASGRTLEFHTGNSFSFEGEKKTGLREELGLEDRGGSPSPPSASLSIEYSFQHDSPMLSIAAEIRYPRFAAGLTVDEYAPLALSLLDLGRGRSAIVEASAPDGSAASYDISDRNGQVIVPGASHRVRLPGGEWLLLRAAPQERRCWGLFPFRITRVLGRRFLEVNPFGSYAPINADALSARRERFSLLIGIGEGSRDR